MSIVLAPFVSLAFAKQAQEKTLSCVKRIKTAWMAVVAAPVWPTQFAVQVERRKSSCCLFLT
jgi:hypothetical protein